MKRRLVVGVTGFMGSGKGSLSPPPHSRGLLASGVALTPHLDTFANYLTRSQGFTHISLSDHLREEVRRRHEAPSIELLRTVCTPSNSQPQPHMHSPALCARWGMSCAKHTVLACWARWRAARWHTTRQQRSMLSRLSATPPKSTSCAEVVKAHSVSCSWTLPPACGLKGRYPPDVSRRAWVNVNTMFHATSLRHLLRRLCQGQSQGSRRRHGRV